MKTASLNAYWKSVPQEQCDKKRCKKCRKKGLAPVEIVSFERSVADRLRETDDMKFYNIRFKIECAKCRASYIPLFIKVPVSTQLIPPPTHPTP